MKHLKSIVLLFLTCIFFSAPLLATTPKALWATSVTSAENQSRFSSVAVDRDENIYAAGNIEGVAAFDFGNGVAVSGAYDGANIVLVKYDNDGNAKWAKSVIRNSEIGVKSLQYTIKYLVEINQYGVKSLLCHEIG